MNERIKELLKQSTGTRWYCGGEYSEVDQEKFAELIVKECIGVVENLSPGYKDYRDQIEDAFRRDCVEEIKHKFGVEE
jgi:hypothetical protein